MTREIPGILPTPEERLKSRGPESSIRWGLDRIAQTLDLLGKPHRSFPSVLVGGTVGKGTVCKALQRALTASGHRTGLYLSPHLVRVNERISVDDREIPDADFVRLFDRVSEAEVRAGVRLSYFEVLTCLAFLFLAEREVHLAILEVGLGGRLDATNVCDPILSVLNEIGLDHENYLGPTVEHIAREKAGILRPGKCFVLGTRGAARAVLEGIAAEMAATRMETVSPPALGENLPGALQRNLRIAWSALHALERLDVQIQWDRVESAWNLPLLPGRFHVLKKDPPLILDGAHNPIGAEALREFLQSQGDRYVLVLGFLKDKRYVEMVNILKTLASVIVFTRPPSDRAADPGDVMEATGAEGFLVPCPRRAYELALALAGSHSPVCVTGSLYLVGEILSQIERFPERL